MPRKSFSFQAQLAFGRMGVQLAALVLRGRFPHIKDLQDDPESQKRGIDLDVEGLGRIEVKTDSHEPERFFLETDVEGKPGTVDRSCSDFFCIMFYNARVLYIIPRPELQKWLRDHWAWIQEEHPDWVHHIHSHRGKQTWVASGVVVPKHLLMRDIKIAVIEWTEQDEILVGSTWRDE